MASIRSWLSMVMISAGSMPGSRRAPRTRRRPSRRRRGWPSRWSRSSGPAPPRSWMPTTRPASSSARHASMSRFSSNGSPTCTVGRFAASASPSPNPAEASTLTPPMPSRPVVDPSRTARLPTPLAWPRTSRSARQKPKAQHVDERIALVCLVEHDLAADRGHADRVAVAGDAAHHAFRYPSAAGVVEGTEAQRIHERDRSGPHGEDVPQDAADAGGGALVGLDGRRVVVALDADRGGDAVPDVDDAGVLARPDEHPWAPRVGRRRRWTLDDLYEQCSLHITEYIASSSSFGTRPRISSMSIRSRRR